MLRTEPNIRALCTYSFVIRKTQARFQMNWQRYFVGLLILFTQYSEVPLLYPKDGGKSLFQTATILAAIGKPRLRRPTYYVLHSLCQFLAIRLLLPVHTFQKTDLSKMTETETYKQTT